MSDGERTQHSHASVGRLVVIAGDVSPGCCIAQRRGVRGAGRSRLVLRPGVWFSTPIMVPAWTVAVPGGLGATR